MSLLKFVTTEITLYTINIKQIGNEIILNSLFYQKCLLKNRWLLKGLVSMLLDSFNIDTNKIKLRKKKLQFIYIKVYIKTY